ncbi:pericentriolar material 1 protein isoform X2 [Anoplophora glabripennis]|uniref:pericentriolar material 1 protein isoform X2 n=1 Tax=Anoplophora glabripennis TaxID=217634 RepID=UPI0008737912|nr:pericentriolar material 1 protein isoform X2 [Anoplophora glabripennis]
MSEERRKINKQSTGTVPKVKYRNNTSYSINERERSRSLTNNLASYWHHPSDPSNLIRNSRGNQRNNYFNMDTTLEEPTLQPLQNGSINFNQTANGTVTPNTSSSTSRRNSSSLKCDNVTKYPDKKQIEDKLHQIREYLKITNSLMTSMKNEDQLVENGVDNVSEHSSSSFRRNDIDVNLVNPSQEIDMLKDQQMALMRLQQKAENKLRDARHAQTKMSGSMFGNDVNDISNRKDNKLYSEHDFDAAIKELEERAKRLRSPQLSNQKAQDNILAKVHSLHNQIITMHNANDERENLIETLDNRDAELRMQHADLQNKLQELQNKKLQVDQLVAQLQSFGDEEEEDIGGQVKKIVTMKDQLRKLKDMLELVKTTENIMQNTNASAEAQAVAYDICTSAENFLEKDVQKPRLQSQVQNETNVLRNDNYSSTIASDNQPKEVNKRSIEQGCRGLKPRITSHNEKLSLQAELEAKKKELEEIMGKHKASTSNLNHDVGADVKSEFSCTSNAINEGWVPLIPPQSHHADSDRFSSDEEDINDYSAMHDNHNVLNLPSSNFSHLKTKKFRSVPCDDYIQPSEFERPRGISRTPERNDRSNSAATSGYVREHPRSNTEQETRTQVQKQLQLIKSVCDSMLEQQSAASQQSNVQQLRNNLTPSPLYSEPRRYASPNPHTMNALNVINPNTDAPWFPGSNMHGNLNADINNYQNWLATNTIQTQSFMLNTLNQCCQMLWLQQRELVSLRNTVTLLQERMESNPYGGHSDQLPSTLQTPQDQRSSAQYRPVPNQKVNHVSAAFSLPNLNQYNAPPSNLDLNYINQNNVQSGRLLDPCLNNVNHLNATQGVEHANNILHGVNSNINHSLPNQMWNGQALNNQVAPGNRANNYWDNFRSYSRQNLLSTKNNEVLQNPSCLDRSNISNERTNPFSLMTFSKSNSEQDSTSTSQENTPQRRGPSFRLGRHENTNVSVIPPPDVLNVNHNSKVNGHLDLSSSAHHDNTEDVNIGLQMLLNLNAYNDTCSNHSNLSEEQIFKECIPGQSLRRNEWNDEVSEEQLPKTKLFDELRENVYKEVASLISANETRPHFLIQLFRDLQMIGSDSLRLKILQSIQMVITHSLMSSQNSNKHSLESQQTSSDLEGTQIPEYFSLQSTVWSKPMKNSLGTRNTSINAEVQNTFKGAIPFLNEHEDEVIQSALLSSLKQILLGSESFKDLVKDTVFQKHFSNVLDEVLEQYRGKSVRDVKVHLIQTLNELLCGELSFIQLIQETNPEQCLMNCSNDIELNAKNCASVPIYESQSNNTGTSQVVDNIQNGDLAEADQSRILSDDIEEEGAVGGILENTQGTDTKTATQSNCEEIEMTIDFSCNGEGLDQVPTRLPIKVKSRSATPNKDRSNSQPDQDPF